ncbi:cell cycle checkpoint protein rad17 [Ophiostoma piceae UAMH 11346]|uniref:Cell cycle checkpoint protein rad17 n=1 Tax=Ophiostoma piceae (strain UAMH 11346) TaxID=1262450 RepID=S3CJ75_OPHP1|nr:cell cycle checkpoint protein rad17 [Ophiostoma piceae UAMH 11346]
MAPRRKRTVLDDSDSEEERVREQRKTNLRNFFSPNSKSAAASASRATIASPSTSTSGDIPAIPTTPTPVRRTRSTAKTPTKTPIKSPTKADQLLTSSPVVSSPFGRILTSRIKDSNGNKGATNGGSNGKSPCPSPEKRRGSRGLKLADEKGKSADLVALFTKQTAKALSSPPKKTASLATLGENNSNGADAEDTDPITSISDDEIADDEIPESSAVVASYVGSRAQKRWKSNGVTTLSSSQQLPPSSFQSMGPPSSSQALSLPTSQRFKRPVRPGASNGSSSTPTTALVNDDDSRPWSERFAPTNLEELAVHKKKVTDVRRWIDDVMGGRSRQRLLVLKGAAGTGKTTTMRLLAKDMDLDILEWRNPTGASSAGLTSQGYTSAATQFDEFLNRGSRFTQLDLDDTSSDSDDASSAAIAARAQQDARAARRRKIIIIEEFPNTFMRSSSALTGFRNSVLQYLAANTPSMTAYAQRRASSDPQAIAPVVMIVSETLLTTTSASADSFTAHRLLGPELLRHPGTTLIEFNAIAPSLLAKALELIVQKEARKSGRRRTPGPLVLKRLGEVGDVRSAIASLEFFCVKGDDQGDWGAKVAFTKSRKGPKDAVMTKGERETLEMVSRREASLGVFHAVGKVVYNKRDDLPPPAGSEEALAEVLPNFLAHHARPKPSLVAVDSLIDETGTDTHTFISSLHENYALSCEQTGPRDAMSSIDYINGCIEYLSESDLLCPTWDIFFGGHGTNRYNFGRDSGSHVLRQDEMAFQVAVRGLLFSLPSPVKRSSASNHYQRSGASFNGGDGGTGGGGGGNQFKMFYPMYLKLWRSREEMEALVDVWSSKLLRGEMGSYGGSVGSSVSKGNGAGVNSGGLSSSQRPLNNSATRALTFRRPQQKFGISSSQATSQSQATSAASNGHSSSSAPQRRPPRGADPNRKTPFASIKEEEIDDKSGLVKAAEKASHTSVKPDPDNDEADSGLATPLLSLGSSARQEMILERLPYMALIARGKRCSFGTLGMRDLEKVVSFHGIGAVAAATGAEEAEEDVADAGLGAGNGVSADDAWATDKQTDDSSPRKRRRPAPQASGRHGSNNTTQPNGRKPSEAEELDGLSMGLPMYKLVLSDDDIEDVD